MQHVRLPGELRDQGLEALVDVHQVVRRRLAEAQPQPCYSPVHSLPSLRPPCRARPIGCYARPPRANVDSMFGGRWGRS